MLKKNIISLIFILFLVVCYFSNWVDLFLAKSLYDYNTGTFYGENHVWCKIIYYSVPIIVTIFIIASFMMLTILYFDLFKSYISVNFISKKQIIIILSILILGPGILVNYVLKNNWGRPRPYQVIRDHEVYRPFYQPNFGVKNDNSFPSGHASIGFFLGVPLLVLGRRKLGFIVSILAGSFIGFVRILQGGHFFSDVLFAGIIIWFSIKIINYFFKFEI
jgi:lipid A 4'-phosphatase